MSQQRSRGDDSSRFSFDVASRLLESVVSIADHHSDLMERRRAVVTMLVNEIDADCGLWSRGHGEPTDKSIANVAEIWVGFTDKQQARIAELSFDADVFQDFYCSVFADLKGTPRTRSLREEDFIDGDGTKLPRMRKHYADGGWGSWLQNVRYFPRDAYSNIVLLRNLGRPAFNQREADLLNLVCASVSWLHTTIGEPPTTEAFRRLTERQRTVLMMLLDGLPRKVIARRLGISEDTVGEHVSAIFESFNVSSAMELASLFLRNQ